MRNILLIIAGALAISGCKKDKFTTAPQITFKTIAPQGMSSVLPITQQESAPKLVINVTDQEGDLGFINGKDTSRVYIKNLRTNRLDSIFLPDIRVAAGKRFQADISVNLYQYMGGCSSGPRPKVDSVFFEVYVQDFAKNKSNVIRTDIPALLFCQ
jgi:uncharacterized lipoprotein YajG